MSTKVEKTVTVDVPIGTAYNQWTQFEDFPQFMGGVQHVEQLDDQRLHWIAEIGGVRREWYATILEQRPDEKIAWAATEGATNAGAVYFSATADGGSSVTLELEYEPEGVVEKVGDALSIVERQAQSDVDKFKAFIESRHDATGGWRGDVVGQVPGTPGVESAAMSEGDTGKAGISGKVAAVGVAAAAAGIAVAATRSGSSKDTDETSTSNPQLTEPPRMEVVEETTYTATPTTDTPIALDGTYDTPGDVVDERTDDVELDSTTSGITDHNDGNPRGGV